MIVCANFTSEDPPIGGLGSWARSKTAQNILQWSSKGRTSGSYPENNVQIVRLHPKNISERAGIWYTEWS